MRIYASVGIADRKSDELVVYAGEETHWLTDIEKSVWAAGLFRFETLKGIEISAADSASKYLSAKITEVQVRMIVEKMIPKGIMVSGEGSSMEAAVEDLLCKCYVMPLGISLAVRIRVFLQGIFSGQRISRSLKAFSGLKNKDQHLLKWLSLDGKIISYRTSYQQYQRLELKPDSPCGEMLADFYGRLSALYQNKQLIIDHVPERGDLT